MNKARNMKKFINELGKANRGEKLNNPISDDPQDHYDTFMNIISTLKEKCMPSKTVRFDKYKHKLKP